MKIPKIWMKRAARPWFHIIPEYIADFPLTFWQFPSRLERLGPGILPRYKKIAPLFRPILQVRFVGVLKTTWNIRKRQLYGFQVLIGLKCWTPVDTSLETKYAMSASCLSAAIWKAKVNLASKLDVRDFSLKKWNQLKCSHCFLPLSSLTRSV